MQFVEIHKEKITETPNEAEMIPEKTNVFATNLNEGNGPLRKKIPNMAVPENDHRNKTDWKKDCSEVENCYQNTESSC